MSKVKDQREKEENQIIKERIEKARIEREDAKKYFLYKICHYDIYNEKNVNIEEQIQYHKYEILMTFLEKTDTRFFKYEMTAGKVPFYKFLNNEEEQLKYALLVEDAIRKQLIASKSNLTKLRRDILKNYQSTNYYKSFLEQIFPEVIKYVDYLYDEYYDLLDRKINRSKKREEEMAKKIDKEVFIKLKQSNLPIGDCRLNYTELTDLPKIKMIMLPHMKDFDLHMIMAKRKEIYY